MSSTLILTTSEPHASAYVHGIAQWIVMDDPPPEGLDRLIVAAGPGVAYGPIGNCVVSSWFDNTGVWGWRLFDGEQSLPLHPGCIVGAVTLAERVPVRQNGKPTVIQLTGDRLEVWERRFNGGAPRWYATDDISDQRPWADWSPGRWAWRFENPKPTTQECPVCGGEVRWTPGGTWIDEDRDPCPACHGDGTCPPIPYPAFEGLAEFDPGRLR